MILQGQEWEDFKAQCGKYEYDWKLFVDTHLYMLLKPTDEAVQAGCTNVVMHAHVPSKDGFGDFIKRVVKPGSAETTAMFQEGWENGVFPHRFPFALFADAFDAAQTNPSGTKKTHDIVLNNCGDFVMQFVDHMGIKAESWVSVIADILLKEGGDLIIEDIMDSEVSLLKDDEAQVDAETLVFRLVASRFG